MLPLMEGRGGGKGEDPGHLAPSGRVAMSFVATHRPPALSDALPRPTASEMNQETSEKGAGGIKSRRPTDEIKRRRRRPSLFK